MVWKYASLNVLLTWTRVHALHEDAGWHALLALLKAQAAAGRAYDARRHGQWRSQKLWTGGPVEEF
jgi:hypothetical protein